MVGGVDHEAELAAWRLRLQQDRDVPDRNDGERAARRRLIRQEGEEQFEGRLLALAVVGVVYVLVALFG